LKYVRSKGDAARHLRDSSEQVRSAVIARQMPEFTGNRFAFCAKNAAALVLSLEPWSYQWHVPCSSLRRRLGSRSGEEGTKGDLDTILQGREPHGFNYAAIDDSTNTIAVYRLPSE
jgi:hypothetical protein